MKMALIRISIIAMFFFAETIGAGYIHGNCKDIKGFRPNAPSGIYYIQAGLYIIEVYCEMGLNGGGYTFINPQYLIAINDLDLQSLITDHSSILMRIRSCNGTQPYTVLEQLPQYATIPIKYSLNNFDGYQGPQNAPVIGNPFLFIGFLPRSVSAARTVQGFKANGVSRSFSNADARPNSYIALFPNFSEKTPSTYGIGTNSDNFPFCSAIFEGVPNPSARVMPPEYFMFAEFHFGGGGCYTQTDTKLSSKCMLGFHIGFR